MKNELLVSLGMKQLMPQQRSDLLPNPVALTGTNIQTNELAFQVSCILWYWNFLLNPTI